MRIQSPRNEALKDIRRLRRCKGDHALLEGPHLCREAVTADLPIERVLVSPQWMQSDEGRELLPTLEHRLRQTAEGQRIPDILEVEDKLLGSLMDADSPRGILVQARLPRAGVEALPRRSGALYFLLDGLQDPGNVGAVARVAESVGAAGMALTPGCAHPNHSRALRGSAGSLLRVPTALRVELEALAQHLDGLQPMWVALAPRDGTPLWRADLRGTIVLMVGAEGGGLSEAALAQATLPLTIPLEAPVESLNAAVAAAVVAFEAARQRRPGD